MQFAIRIDEAEEFQSREQELADAECLKELLMKHSVMKRGGYYVDTPIVQPPLEKFCIYSLWQIPLE